jgi:hypothetical protein
MGAITGARPAIRSNREKKIISARPEYRSRAMAREITMPAAPAKPWMSRSTASTVAEGARAQATEATR